MSKKLKNPNTEFTVRLEGIRLSEKSEKRIEEGIQALVLSELAAYKPDPEAPPRVGGPALSAERLSFVARFPKEWLGFMALRVDRTLNPQLVKQLGDIEDKIREDVLRG